jgi:cytochrome c peroxidase
MPPVTFPEENPYSNEKRLLGKILFWDEQLSSTNDVACGSCHIPSSGGADPRIGTFPGKDKGDFDDVYGSPGVIQLDTNLQPIKHEIFGYKPQVTTRTAPAFFNALWAEKLFWDGRAGPEFLDPSTGETLIQRNGALEAQVLMTLSSSVEMTYIHHSWGKLIDKVTELVPLNLASKFPDDIKQWLARYPNYPLLFNQAFSDTKITPERIAYAIATYERTLVADQTPWDKYQSGDKSAMSDIEKMGWKDFQDLKCVECHEPPLFTNNLFFNIGLSDGSDDSGRNKVTNEEQHIGDMKVPSLRNTGLKNRLMHSGEFSSISEAINHYSLQTGVDHRDQLPGGGDYTFDLNDYNRWSLEEFIKNALTDPRVKNEEFPFDRPQLSTEK